IPKCRRISGTRVRITCAGLNANRRRAGRLQAGWIRQVDRIVICEGIGVRCGRGARNEERIAAGEATERRVVEAGAELRDAEGREGVAEVPLLVAVERA